ncbi:CAP domain-containing protein [Dethiobacter alkaliphilus]|uniref:CAP domain-containing protein n=1 Tax=Dethiobacter alkaliphilus TaxID=427926 RepID=UPI002227F627|nr:CAP domain-containing protein [Dethiobacter alkaliphilus]MCW3489265.1 CAP domain-containing protein [Dethiobacter alkaliphilus]
MEGNFALTQEEQIVFQGINKERISRGLEPLQINPVLVRLAREKSRDMVDNNYFAHRSPTLGRASDMMRAADLHFNYAGENLARTTTPQNAVALFMGSSPHRSTLLNHRYSETGVGIVRVGRQIYVTQMFIGFN